MLCFIVTSNFGRSQIVYDKIKCSCRKKKRDFAESFKSEKLSLIRNITKTFFCWRVWDFHYCSADTLNINTVCNINSYLSPPTGCLRLIRNTGYGLLRRESFFSVKIWISIQSCNRNLDLFLLNIWRNQVCTLELLVEETASYHKSPFDWSTFWRPADLRDLVF